MRPLDSSIGNQTYQGAGHFICTLMLSHIHTKVLSEFKPSDPLAILKGLTPALAFAGDSLFLQAIAITAFSCVRNTYQLHE